MNGRRAVRAREPYDFYFYLTGVREDVIEPDDSLAFALGFKPFDYRKKGS